MATLLEVNNLSIRFGPSEALCGLSFTIGRGQSLGLVGESGSGKSVTALALIGLLPHTATISSGTAHFTCTNGSKIDLLSLQPKELGAVRGSSLAMIFQEPMTSLNPSMRCGAQVEEAVALHQALRGEAARVRSLALLEELQLHNPQKVYKSYPHQLSGGQKQRVSIAMALAGNPSLLIADEPTTALDVTVQKEITTVLKEIQRARDMSLIFISHDLGVIAEVTDQTIVLHRGQEMERGSTASILTNPQSLYTKGLIASRPPLKGRPSRLITVGDFMGRHEDSFVNLEEPNDLTTQEEKTVFEVRNLTIEFASAHLLRAKAKSGGFRAVNQVSFCLNQGETLGVVGESGSGKTTLGRSLLGLNTGYSGSIKYLDRELECMSPSEMKRFRRQVQMIFQDPFSSLNPRLTIGEALMEPLRVHGMVKNFADRKRSAMKLLDEVSLPSDSFYRYPHEFSGGQRQRIATARALTLEPQVLICDEMVSALDVSVQAHILNLLNDLKRQRGLTYLFISHDLSVVRYMSNRLLVMRNGQIVEAGGADSIFSAPKTDYTAKLLDSIPGLDTGI